MPIVNISSTTHAMIRQAARYDFKEEGIQRPDGSWDVPLQQDTIDRIKQNAFPGETLDDTIQRLFSTSQ